ncbi:hypothetical protein SPHV1_760015 [Novosphingobium sp. KN65.2]|nr:hypothetical protein SPHV1_760015 [Novosphingobium sp. KN65.2]
MQHAGPGVQMAERRKNGVLRASSEAMEEDGLPTRGDRKGSTGIGMGGATDFAVPAMPSAFEVIDDLACGCVRGLGHSPYIAHIT